MSLESDFQSGHYIKYFSQTAGFRAALVNGTAAVAYMQSIQNTYPLASIAVGRAMVGMGLINTMVGGDESRMSAYFVGTGPLGSVFAEGDESGGVRGYCKNPQAQVPYKKGEALRIGDGIGAGQLRVVKTTDATQEPQQGMVDIQTGEVAEDLVYFLNTSYQIPSLLVLGVGVNEYGKVEGAGGLFVELLPGAPEETIVQLEINLKNAPPLLELIQNKKGPAVIVDHYLKGFNDLKVLECESVMSFKCRCSQSRFERAMEVLPTEELTDIVQKKSPIDAHCEFCGQKYQIGLKVIQDILLAKKH